MSEEPRPLLAFAQPTVADRPPQPPRDMPVLSKPTGGRQRERLAPQFRELAQAFAGERARLASGLPDEVDPALVVVLDLAGSIQDFQNAINRIPGLEFLAAMFGEGADADDDFHMVSREDGRTESPVLHSLYLAMSNAQAIEELVQLFDQWQADQSVTFENGLNKFKNAFQQLTAIRRWSPEDRVRETGLLEAWRETLDVVGQSVSFVKVEIELWHRVDAATRRTVEAEVEQLVVDSGGRVLARSQIGGISYHALLAELPIQQVETVLGAGAGSIQLLNADAVMFVSPFRPMSVGPGAIDPVAQTDVSPGPPVDGAPRIALLDGLPLANHAALSGRLIIDDPDGVGEDYAVGSRNHGTAMASLIIHGDLSAPGEPLDRPVYVRPILRPHEFIPEHEVVVPDQLLTDLLHRAVKRIVEGEDGRPAAAPSVRIVNVSVGDANRALVRRMSPAGRLLDWLAHSYNLLFVVSAGNHEAAIEIAADAAGDAESTRLAAQAKVYSGSLLRGILPPGDALNVLTIGATHDDASGAFEVPDTVWDIVTAGAPATHSATGPGVDRSVKPDFHHTGGRSLFARPVIDPGVESVRLEQAETSATGPGVQVAAPGRQGATNATAFTAGSSNATALVSREASRLFDVLEAGSPDRTDLAFPDAQFHPLLVRALLAHATGWGEWEARLRRELALDSQQARRRLTALLGYGALNLDQLGRGATNRAVLIAGGSLARNQRHTYDLPLPPSLRARAEWHRITITLASMAPTIGHLTRYRAAKVFFATPDTQLAAGDRVQAEHNTVRRGSLQHEIVEGERAMVFGDGDGFPVHIDCMDDAMRLRAGKVIRYALVVSIQTAVETSATIHDEVRTQLRQRAQAGARERVETLTG